jgi:hypothetical protein
MKSFVFFQLPFDQSNQERDMEIYLAKERAFHYIPQVTLEVAMDRMEQKKVQAVSGTLGALFSRAKPDEVQLVSVENRLEAFWQISVKVHTVYERNRSYAIPLSGPEIKHVTLLGQDLPVTVDHKGKAHLTVNGVEHCVEESARDFTFDGSGVEMDMSQYSAFPKTEVVDLENFAPEDVLVVPPKASASTVVRSVLSQVITPVDAGIIHEERVDVETLEINFRPVYAMEYHWIPKDKHVVLEFDTLTGEFESHGEKMGGHAKGLLTSNLIFDLGEEAAGVLVPGGKVAVKLVRAVYDHKKK